MINKHCDSQHAHPRFERLIAQSPLTAAATAATWAMPWALLLHIQSRTRLGKSLSLAALLSLGVLCLLTYNRQSPVIIGAMFVVGLPLVRLLRDWRTS